MKFLVKRHKNNELPIFIHLLLTTGLMAYTCRETPTPREDLMPQNITKSAKSIVQEAMASVPAISVEEAMALSGSDAHVFVDLRDGTEQAKTGRIPGAVASSRGMMEFHLDPESPIHNPAFNQDKTYVFYCASGGRSAMAAKVALEMGLHPVLNMSGGFGAWSKAGGAVEPA